MPDLSRLAEVSRKLTLSHIIEVNDGSPWTAPAKPLSTSVMTLVTTAAMHLRDDQPFTSGDKTFRVIPSDTPAKDIILSQFSIGFDRSGVLRDLNLILPVDRLREMRDRGEVGGIGPRFYSFLGAQRQMGALATETGPEVARRLKADGVDVVLLTGA